MNESHYSPKYGKGQTMLAVVMWATGISVAVAGTFYSNVSAKFEKQQNINLVNENRVTKVETKLDSIDEKIDILLKVNGVNPDQL